MPYLGSWKIDDYLTFAANTHRFNTGAATDGDAVPAYRIYEDETGTPIVTGNMAKLDDANTTGFYSERVQLTAASGFEKGKTYTIYISVAVNSVTGTISHTFQVEAETAGSGSPLVIGAGGIGDYKEDAVIYFSWRTINQDGVPVDPSVAGTVTVYKDDGTSKVTAPTGITNTNPFNGVTGQHLTKIDLSANTFYAKEKDYSVLYEGATIDSQSIDAVIATFSIEKEFQGAEFEKG